jgi:hypothetical protein
MQKDYMAMAQGQGISPQQPPTPGGDIETVVENLKQILSELQMSDAVEEAEIQQLAKLIVNKDEAAIAENKLYQIISETMTQLQNTPDEQPQQDFAAMAGGGMGGR